MTLAIKTLKVRVRDLHAKVLAAPARAVNFVGNDLLLENDLNECEGSSWSLRDMPPYTTVTTILALEHERLVAGISVL